MNVKQGDMALIIHPTKYVGFVCEVLRFVGAECGQPNCWLTKFREPVDVTSGQKTDTPLVPDAWMRPVSGLPDLQEVERKETVKVTR